MAFSTATPFNSFWRRVDNLFGFSFPSRQPEIKCWEPKHDTKARDIMYLKRDLCLNRGEPPPPHHWLEKTQVFSLLVSRMVFNPRQKSTWFLNIQLERLTLSYTTPLSTSRFNSQVNNSTYNNCRHRLNFIFAKSWPRSASKAGLTGQPQGLFPVFSLPSSVKGGSVGNTRLPRAKMLLVPMNISSDG